MNPSLDDSDRHSKHNCSGCVVNLPAIDQDQDFAVVLRELRYCLSHCFSQLNGVKGFIWQLTPIGELTRNRVALVRLVDVFQWLVELPPQ